MFVWRSQQLRVNLEPAPVIAAGSSKRARRAAHGHAHNGHTHDAGLTPDLKRRDVAVLGVVGGLVPSGSALILLLSSIALNEVAYGLLLIVAFGIGMAAVLIGISTGIVFSQIAAHGLERGATRDMKPPAVWLPTASGLLVVALGLFLTLDALRKLP